MSHPVRALFERMGLVRKPGEAEERYAEADKVVEDSQKAAREARARRRRLAEEANSYRGGNAR